MNNTLQTGAILEVPEPFTYRVRLADGREVFAQPSRLHFGHLPEDVEALQSFGPWETVTVRVDDSDPTRGVLVRAVQTESEWHASGDPAALLETVRPGASGRKFRLFACGCCRLVSDLLPDGPHRRLLRVVEEFADGQAGPSEVAAALAAGESEERQLCQLAEEVENDPVRSPEVGARARAVWATRIAAQVSADSDLFAVALDTARTCCQAAGLRAVARAGAREGGLSQGGAGPERIQAFAEEVACFSQAEAAREIFGNPFRPVAAPPSWRSPEVVHLARQIYAGGHFGRFLELHAALRTAGCANRTVLDHCRKVWPHARGCWVLDLLLGQA